jgi:phage portal protein BeeE
MPQRWSGVFGEMLRELNVPGMDTDKLARKRYIQSLRSPAPVQWLSSHLTESQRVTGPVYVAIKVMGDQGAQATCTCYRWKGKARDSGDLEAREELPRNHPVCRLMRRPNKWETGGMLRRRRIQQICATGMSLLWRVDDGLRTPRELWSVPTGTFQPVAISSKYPEGGYRVMPYFPGPLAMVPGAWQTGGVVVPADHMIRVILPHPLVQAEGLSPLTACATEMDSIEGITRARNSKVRRQFTPSIVIEADPQVIFPTGDDLEAQRQELRNLMGGPDRAGEPGFLSPGLHLKEWAQAHGNIELGWQESWSQLVSFVLSVFGVTQSLAFMSEDANYSALFAMLKQYNLFSLCPLLELLADCDNIQLIEPFFGDDYFVEYTPRRIDDHNITEAELANDLKAGIRTVGEIRKLRHLVPSEFDDERAFAISKGMGAGPGSEGSVGGGDAHADGRPKKESSHAREADQGRERNAAGRGTRRNTGSGPLAPRTMTNGRK